MEIPNREEVAEAADVISSFYVGLKLKGIPAELAALLTRDYFNNWLSWEEDDDGEEDDDDNDEVPSPMWPPGTKFYIGTSDPYVSE